MINARPNLNGTGADDFRGTIALANAQLYNLARDITEVNQ